MQSSRERRTRAAASAFLYLTAWWLLYAGLPLLFHAGADDAGHVLCEGASAAALLVPFLRDRGTGSPLPAGRAGWPTLLLVPVFLLAYAAIEMFCLAGTARYEGPAEVSVWHVLRTCVTAPLMEELGCRWISFYRLRRGFGFWPSALASAALFSLIHVDVDVSLAIAVIPHAILYCLIYEITGRIRYCVAGHVAVNMLALPGTAWADSALERCLWGVPLHASVPLLVSVTAVIVLLCVFRDRLFVRHGGRPDRPAGSRSRGQTA